MGRTALTVRQRIRTPAGRRGSSTLAAVHWDKVSRGELIAAASGIVLAVSLFLNWFSTDYSNRNSKINGKPFQTVTAWESERVISVLLLLAAIAPLILLWIIVREHQLSWPRGELTAVVAITAFVLIVLLGIVVRPGDPRDTISLEIGWFLALVAAIGMAVGAAQRSKKSGGVRKPPGTL